MKTRGLLTLWRRKHRPAGSKEYVVEMQGRLVAEFRRMKPAVLWMKQQKEGQTRQVKPDGARCDDCGQVLGKDDLGISCPDGAFVGKACCFDKGNH